jgi:hypothetical protein
MAQKSIDHSDYATFVGELSASILRDRRTWKMTSVLR